MTIRYILLQVLFVTGTYTLSGQTAFVLSGEVTDEEKHPVPSGGVYLLKAADSSLVKYSEITNGTFSFDPLPQQDYLLRVTAPGFKDLVRVIAPDQELQLKLVLMSDGNRLREVSITGNRKLYSNEHGNLKVLIENTIFSTTPTPTELLAKLPGVQLSPDGESFTLAGKGQPLIYIDNQRASIADLQSLSVNDIRSIEIIRNPSSKYESEGRAVILISRKVNKKQGILTDLSEHMQFKRFFHNSTGFNTSIKKNRLELKANFQYNRFRQWERVRSDFRITDKDIRVTGDVGSVGIRKQYIFGASAYYQINENDYFSLAVNGRAHNDEFLNTAVSAQHEPGRDLSAYTHNANTGHRPYFNTNFNYNKKFNKKKSNLFAGGQYASFTRELSSTIADDINGTGLNPVQDRYQKYKVDVFTGRTDYEQQLRNGMKLEAGLNAVTAKATSFLRIENVAPAGMQESDYLYDEQDYAAYIQLSGSIKQLSYTGGLRAENTRIQGRYKNSTNLQVDQDYTQLFPKAGVDYAIDSNNTFSLSYAKSIARPNYANSNQITTYINPFFEWSNNLNLSPGITDELGVSFQHKAYSLQLAYVHTKNPVFYTAEYSEQDNKFRMITSNLAAEEGMNATFTLPFTYKQFTSTNILNATFNKVRDALAISGKVRPYVYLYTGNQLRLPKNLTLMLNAWYLSERYEGVFERQAIFQMDVAVSGVIFKKLYWTVNGNDIFRSLASREKFTINTVASDGTYYEDVRALVISLRYSLGKLHDSKFRNKDVNEGERMR